MNLNFFIYLTKIIAVFLKVLHNLCQPIMKWLCLCSLTSLDMENNHAMVFKFFGWKISNLCIWLPFFYSEYLAKLETKNFATEKKNVFYKTNFFCKNRKIFHVWCASPRSCCTLVWLHVYSGRLGLIVVDLYYFALFEDFSLPYFSV